MQINPNNPSNPRNPGSGLRIIFFGTPEFAAHILREFVRNGENVVAVVTLPDKLQGRGMKLKPSAVKERALELAIPVLTPEKHRDPDFLNMLRAFNADVFVVVAYKILPKEVYEIPRFGTFNIHASLLPKYRGAAPINWAILTGETRTGITTFLLDEKVDTGQMLLQEAIPIGPDETAGELHDRLMILGANVALHTLQGLASGSLRPVPQTNEGASPAPKLFPKDCEIDFQRPVLEVHNFIRGLSFVIARTDAEAENALSESRAGAASGAWTTVGKTKLKLLRTTLAEDVPENLKPGAWGISPNGKRLFVGAANRALEVLELQREGKRAMNADEFLRGNAGLFHTS